MPDVISVRFRGRGKAYDFDPGSLTLHEGDQVVVETSKGSELGACVSEVHDLPEDKVYSPLRPVLRLATQDDLRRAEEKLARLLGSFERGRLMTAGIPAAIVGRPNAGKSSLLNALLGYERAIVTDVPGTTRDTIEEKLRLGSLLLRLIDTAGIRETEDAVERLGVERSRRAMERASLVLAVIDGSGDVTGEDLELLHRAERCPKAVLVLTKADLERHVSLPETGLPIVTVSSVTGEGLEELERAIRALFPLPQVPAGEILTNARQAEAVSRAKESVHAALEAMETGCTPDIVLTESETAMAALGELTGRNLREDVTARIFERFCVGK